MNRSFDDGGHALSVPYATFEELSFAEMLDEWMRRAPWLACSLAAHAVILFVLMAVPWEVFDSEEPRTIQAAIERPPEEVFEEPPPEVEEPIAEEPADEPELMDAVVDEVAPSDDAYDDSGDPDFANDRPFEDLAHGPLGIGGSPAGGKYGQRFGNGRRPRAGRGTHAPVQRALEWLVAHQDDDGRWDVDGFMKHDPPDDRCDGAGSPLHDVGVTGLALLALLGDGHTTTRGEFADAVARGVAFLRSRQDPDTGLIGDDLGKGFLYDHAIATLAICEALYFSRSPLLERTARPAVGLIVRARNPYGAWRYGARPDGDNDTSVTGWMVFALKAAEEAGLDVDPEAYAGALSWLDEVTDPSTGRVGYGTAGSASSRIEGINDHFPREAGEALTAVGLLSRFFLGQDPAEHEVMRRHADLLLAKLPAWDPDGYGNDMYYWYYGSYAMFQMGGRHWERWNTAMRSAVVDSQRREGSRRGSWDPIGPWGWAGGRVYATACMTLCLQTTYRYGRVLGSR